MCSNERAAPAHCIEPMAMHRTACKVSDAS
jgi:hypothetical protein